MKIKETISGGIEITDKGKLFRITPKLIFKRDRGHGGGAYVSGVKLLLHEEMRALDKEQYDKWKENL